MSRSPVSRELDLVELVSPDGAAIGSSTVVDAHTAPGRLHRAFSVVLVDPDGRILLQQRAAVKTRFPLAWANSCCGHPAPGEPVAAAGRRRLTEELGVAGIDLTDVGVYAYTAVDPATGRVEREYDHVLVGYTPGTLELTPDPAEVAAVRWVPFADLDGLDDAQAPWLAGVLDLAGQAFSKAEPA